MLFTSPVGTVLDRLTPQFPPEGWFDATGYAKRYNVGLPSVAYHTGADLNLNVPKFDSDAHSGVYAIADGVVLFVRSYPVWGNIVVVKHGRITVRYGHVENPIVHEDQLVRQGAQIASIGNAFGQQPYHLHFDVVTDNTLMCSPDDWPKLDLERLKLSYADPLMFLRTQRKMVAIFDRLNVRSRPTTNSKVLTVLPQDSLHAVYAHDSSWFKLAEADGYISRQYAK